MAKLNNLTGMTFGNWLVLDRSGSTGNKAAIWRCRCLLCNTEHDVVGYSLTSGSSAKCRSCVPRETLRKPFRKTRLYTIYQGMLARCYNRNCASYKDYGARGIVICDDWKTNRDSFFQWAISSGYSDGLSIERVDSNGPYSPENCCWISPEKQAQNRRNSIMINYNGNAVCLAVACDQSGINRDTVRWYKQHYNVDYQTAFDHYAERKAP